MSACPNESPGPSLGSSRHDGGGVLLPGGVVNFDQTMISPVRSVQAHLLLDASVKSGLGFSAMLVGHGLARLLQAHGVLGELRRARTFDLELIRGREDGNLSFFLSFFPCYTNKAYLPEEFHGTGRHFLSVLETFSRVLVL